MWRSLILMLAAMAASIAAPAAAAPAARDSMSLSLKGFVGDNAGVLSSAFIDEMTRRLGAIHKRGEITVMMVTAPPLGGPESHRVAEAVGTMMQQANKTNRDWVVFMLIPATREIGMAFSSRNQDAAKALKDADDATRNLFLQELGEAMDAAMMPFFKVNDWEGGMRAGVDAIEGRLDQERPAGTGDTPSADDSAT